MCSEIFRINKNLCLLSNDGSFLAVAFQSNLIVKYAKNSETIHSFVFPDIIEHIEWSPDSEYILCLNLKRAIVQVFSISYPEWKCKITEGSAGLESATWAPDSKSLCTLSDFNIQLSIWCLQTRSVTHIQNLKSSANEKLHFSPDGKRLAVVTADDTKDSVEIYRTEDWKLSRKLICERISSINDLCWSPNGEALCIWCSNSGESKLIIYSTISESHIGVFCPNDQKHDEEENVFHKQLRGIELVKWMPSSQLIAISGHNEMVVLINCITWKPFLQLHCDPVITDSHCHNKVFREIVIHNKDPNLVNPPRPKHNLEEVLTRPINIPISKKDCTKIAHFDILEFSLCGHFLAIRHQIYPTTLWILEIKTGDVNFILLQNSISAVKWSPISPRLLILSESSHIFFWTKNEAICRNAPKDITILSAQWHPAGKSVVLHGYNKAVLLNLDNF